MYLYRATLAKIALGTAIGAAISLAIGGTIAGMQGALSGHGFWQAFAEHVSTAYKRVTHLFRNETTEWYKIRVNGEEITCTAGHPFYLPAIDKFIPAEQLEIGENLLLSNGEYGIIGVVEGLIKNYMQLDVKNRKKRPIFNRIMWYNEDDRFVGSSKNAGLLAN